jgi:hypothetical protein
MDNWLQVLLIIGGIILFISILYAIIAYKNNTKTIFRSVPVTDTSTGDVIAYYYMPASLIKITATAKVEIVTDINTNQIDKTILKELSITAVAEIFPDTSQLLLVKYTRSAFANDDVKIGVNAMGLLESAASVTEDRFTNIINALLEAPAAALKTTPAAALAAQAMTPATTTSEIKEYSKEFILTPDKIKVGGGNSFPWIIDVTNAANDHDQADASFKVDFASPFLPPASSGTPTVLPGTSVIAAGDGIYVRPGVALQISFSPGPNNPLRTINANAATITVPDVTKQILLPVTRTTMVKKTQGLKLQNGMLLENAIVKPSEAEALVAIPVNILKAIFSIPAQLLSFRINHVQQQKTLVTEDAALAKAKLDSEKARLGTDAELAKAKLEAQKAITSYEQDLLKAKMETQKAIIDAEKNITASQKDVIKAQQDLLQAQHDLEELRKKLKP